MVVDGRDIAPLLAEAFRDAHGGERLDTLPRTASCGAPAPREQKYELLRARLAYVGPCPARRDYRELCFDLEGCSWNWCTPATAGTGITAKALLLRPGSYGVMAMAIETAPDGRLIATGLAPASGPAMAISGVPVLIHSLLIRSPQGDTVSMAQLRLAVS